jgi:hypothetical protein
MFTYHRLTTLAITAIAAAAVGSAALGTAGSAAANTVDDTFLAQISNHGITYDSAQDAVDAGREVCQELAAGKSGSQIESEFTHLSPSSAAFFVSTAVKTYCPQYT